MGVHDSKDLMGMSLSKSGDFRARANSQTCVTEVTHTSDYLPILTIHPPATTANPIAVRITVLHTSRSCEAPAMISSNPENRAGVLLLSISPIPAPIKQNGGNHRGSIDALYSASHDRPNGRPANANRSSCTCPFVWTLVSSARMTSESSARRRHSTGCKLQPVCGCITKLTRLA